MLSKILLSLFFISIIYTQSLPSLNIKESQTSVSGVSAGAYMATQFQIAHSSIIVGSGIIAGGPYACADGYVNVALTSCMATPETIDLEYLKHKMLKAQVAGKIDSLQNLQLQKTFLFSGLKDTIVRQGVVKKLQKQYQEFGLTDITAEFGLEAEHSWVTTNYGNECKHLGKPYMNNCGYDAAGNILKKIYGSDMIKSPVTQIPNNLRQFSQINYKTNGDSFGDIGYYYIPTACQQNQACTLHVAFHGCEQTLVNVGTDFVINTGLNEYAEANNFVILYPQVKNSEVTPYNPKGCFDWWGYTEELFPYNNIGYATKEGSQIQSIYSMIKDLTNNQMIYE